ALLIQHRSGEVRIASTGKVAGTFRTVRRFSNDLRYNFPRCQTTFDTRIADDGAETSGATRGRFVVEVSVVAEVPKAGCRAFSVRNVLPSFVSLFRWAS